MTAQFSPPWSQLETLNATLSTKGYALLEASSVVRWAGTTAHDLDFLQSFWSDLPPDPHLRDGGRYRRRRHGCFVVSSKQVKQVAHRAHWQPLAYNALHGGMQRWFAPLESAMINCQAWGALLGALARQCSALHGEQAWFIEAHPFRIDTTDGIGRPTPEGAHRDGVDLVAVFILERHAIKGGETRIFEADGPTGLRFTLEQPWSLILLDDHRVIHESTPIQPLDRNTLGWRDTLVITCRSGSFQGEAQDMLENSV